MKHETTGTPRSLLWLLALVFIFGSLLSVSAQYSEPEIRLRIEKLAGELKASSPEARMEAVYLLGDFTKSIHGEYIRMARLAGVEDVWGNIAKEHSGEIAGLLKDADPRVRRAAVEVLAVLKAKEQATALVTRLKDEDPKVKCAAIEALARLETREHAADIAELLEDPDASATAARALAELDARSFAKAHLEKIAARLKHQDCQAVEILASLNAKEYAGDIAVLLKDEHPGMKGCAIAALGDLGAREYAKDIATILRTDRNHYDGFWERNVKRDAVNSLVKLKAKEYAGDIALLLRGQETALLPYAVAALVTLGAKEQAKDIATLLADSDSSTRGTAVRALGDLGAKEYSADLVPMLADHDSSIREYAARALAKLGDKEHTKNIAALLMDREGHVVKIAAECLKELDYVPSAKEVFRMAADAVVRIEARSSSGTAFGSGFLISEDGRILTNRHVVMDLNDEKLCDLENITIKTRDGKSYIPERILLHKKYDLAIVQLKNPPKKSLYLHLASELPEVGEELVIIGHPAGLDWSLSEGKVSQIRNDPAAFF